jgi:GNAT superfamily N-acetyltransferase
MSIHQKDPLFNTALKSRREKRKFMLEFGSKLARQKRFVLFEDDKLAGALSLEIRKNSIFVYAVGLLDKFKRKGYGTYLMDFTEDFARDRKKEIVCFSVLLENNPAVSMYKKLNYKSMGVGLTLLRIFMWKLRDEIENKESNKHKLEFKLITNPDEIKVKNYEWWLNEISHFAGKEASIICDKDNLIEFDFKKEWFVYEIFTDNNSSGLMIIIPSNFFQTLLLFSDPKVTWNKEWLLSFIKNIYEDKIILQNFSQNKNVKRIELSKSSVLQLFLTHQHKNNIFNILGKDLAMHDVTEDRQIMFKKL